MGLVAVFVHMPRKTCSILSSLDSFPTDKNDMQSKMTNITHAHQAYCTFLLISSDDTTPPTWNATKCTQLTECLCSAGAHACESYIEIGNLLHAKINFVVSLFPQTRTQAPNPKHRNARSKFTCKYSTHFSGICQYGHTLICLKDLAFILAI